MLDVDSTKHGGWIILYALHVEVNFVFVNLQACESDLSFQVYQSHLRPLHIPMLYPVHVLHMLLLENWQHEEMRVTI